MVTHSSTLAWRIPWTEKPGRLQSTGSQRVGHDSVTSLSLSPRSRLALDPSAYSSPLEWSVQESAFHDSKGVNSLMLEGVSWYLSVDWLTIK